MVHGIKDDNQEIIETIVEYHSMLQQALIALVVKTQ